MTTPEANIGSWRVETRSPRGTHKLAAALVAASGPGSVFALVGDLGAGKTTFIQGVAAALAVRDLSQVTSPTYTLVNEYPAARTTLVHIDFYRLLDEDNARALGLDEQIDRSDALVAIEWADHLPSLLPRDAIWIRLECGEGRRRSIEVSGIAKPRGLRL